MKKILLLSVCVMLSSLSFAQSQVKKQRADMRQTIASREMKMAPAADVLPFQNIAKKNRPNKAFEDGVWFARPEGALVTAWSDEGSGYYVNSIIVPPYYPVIFENKCEDKTGCTWTINGTDRSEYANEDGDFEWGYISTYDPQWYAEGGYFYTPSYYLPELHKGLTTYKFGEPNNKDYTGTRQAYLKTDSVGMYSFVDEATTKAGYAWGRLVAPGCTNYLFGSGKYTFKDGTVATSHGFVDFFPQPASPLYVEHISLEFYSNDQLLKNGAELTMRIVTVEDRDSVVTLGDSIIAELKATADDIAILGNRNTEYTTSGSANLCNVIFKRSGVDELGQTYDEPFSIDCPFAILVLGFDNPDVDGTTVGEEEADEDHQTQGIEAVLADEEGNMWHQTIYGGGPLSLAARFYGCFDYVEAQDTLYSYDADGNVKNEYPNMNVLRVSEDGKTVANEGADEDHDFGAALFYTYFPWYDHEGMENYYYIDDIDWISATAATDFVDKNDERTGLAAVTFECEPLPAGVTGRSAELHFVGKGYQSELTVILLQGDAKIDDVTAVKSVRTTGAKKAAAYNLAGQRVSKNFRGLTIKDGKKVMVK